MKVSTKLKRWSYALFLGTQISISALGQIPAAPQAAQSPGAASLGTYGNYPVSPVTGKQEININLHTLTDGNVKIPIALDYDASGVRPDIHPGWTGLNFGLSTTYGLN